jgi:exodeoxyribonuclease V gamma subunit
MGGGWRPVGSVTPLQYGHGSGDERSFDGWWRMSFVVHRAERADVLADALAEVLLVPLADPFQAEVVAVHSRGIERWLSNRLAARLGTSPQQRDGVCANLQFPFPGRLVGDALAVATGIDADTDPWRPERLVWPLLDVVEANLDEPWLAVLAAHVGAADPGSPKGDRRFAAVRHLADLFDSYAVHRPAMVRAWHAGLDEDGQRRALPADAVWQAQLWRRLRERVDTASPPERLIAGCEALIADPGVVALPDRFTLFGLTRLPISYLDVLCALAAHRQVNLLALHPSPAAWAAMEALVPADAADAVAAEAATAAVRHPLLRAWGRDSREMHLALRARLATEGDVAVRHHPLPATAPTTLLQRLQHAIRADEAPGGPARPQGEAGDPWVLDPDDRSVQVHACHGRARQAEVVRDAIAHLLAADPTLEPRDVVVMCPDIDEMAPLLRAAFEMPVEPGEEGPEGLPVIPYRLADRSIRQTNPVLGAVAELLGLVDGRITASQVLTFAALPPVRERFRFGDDDLERMAQWIEGTGIRWGLDRAHRAPYDLEAVEAGTWEAGLQRLLLGVTMTEDELRLVGGVLPLDDIDSGDIDLAGRVAELVSRLRDAVERLSGTRSVAGWVAAIDRVADLLLHTRPGDSWQRAQLDRLLSDVVGEAEAGDGPPLRLAEVRDLLANRLRGQPSRAAFRTGDLTMCTLVPMRSVPHRVVCIVGLDDGSFPRGGARDGDDLLVRHRHVGDHDRRAEDRQLLLDAVLAATDALVITYAGRDPRTNEVTPPAVPVTELLDVIDATAPTADGRPARTLIRHEQPLHPSDRRCFESGRLGSDGPWSFEPLQLAGALAASQPRTVPGPFLRGALPPPGADDGILLLDDLVAFVQHPTRAFLRQRLGLSLRVDDDRPVDALPVELDGLGVWSIGDRLLTALLAGGDTDTVCAAEIARGLLPPGALGQQVLERARDKAVAIAAEARAVADGPRSSLDVDVGLADGRRLVGTVPDLVAGVLRTTTFSKLSPKARLAAWVRYLAAVASHPDLALGSATVGWGGKEPLVVRLPSLGPTPEERLGRAVDLLAILVDLRDRGLRGPLPLFTDTSHRYATAVRSGRQDPREDAARFWTSEYNWDKEDRDPEHLLVLGGQRSFDEVFAIAPDADEVGPGWAEDEPSRFGRLARRLWDPLLDLTAPEGRTAERARPVPS